MDAGVVNSIENDNYQYKFGAPQPGDVRSQEAQDDGYETSNGGEGQPAPPPAAVLAPPTPPLEPALEEPVPPAMEEEKPPQDTGEPKTDETVQSDKVEQNSDDETKSDKEPVEEPKEKEEEKMEERLDEVDGTLEKVEPEKEVASASNSPKTIVNEALNPNEDSSTSIRENLPSSPCASNSRSNSSLGRQQISAYRDGIDLATGNMSSMPVQEDREDREDSSSQSQSYPINASMDQQMNPYDMKQRMPQPYMPVRGPDMPFGAIKREPYDMSSAEHDPYAHYKRENDPYSRENIDPYGRNQYKRPEEMFMNNYKEEMPYSGFGIKRDMNPYYHSGGQFGLKREHEQDILGYNGIKRECSEDPYSFVDEEAAVCAMLGQQGGQGMGNQGNLHQDMLQQHLMQSAPKKRGRKKKIKDECPEIKQEPGLDGQLPPVKPVKERKKHDRFNGMPEEEVCRRLLPDHLAQNLDIIIIGINPGLFAAYKGHHYAGPGNHFWKCLYLSGLTQEQMSADEDYKLLHFGIGFTNMVQRATKGSADLTRKEIKEGSQVLLEKLQTFRPKIAVFNGKLIYEVFSGKKDFCFGRQPDTVHGTNTYMWVMPSSSARCAQLPRAADKVPFYSALRRFRDYLNGTLAHVDDAELVFPDTTCRREREENEIRRLLGPDTPCEMMVLEDGTEVPVKKKRGRPKKVKLENGEVVPPAPRAPRAPRQSQQQTAEGLNGEQPPKKKRGRPKKVRPEDQQFLAQQQPQNPAPLVSQPLPNMPLNQHLPSQQNMESNYPQGLLGSRDYSQQSSLGMEANQMMYQGNMSQSNQSMSGGGAVQNQSLPPVNVPATSPYFSQGLGSNQDDQGMGGAPGTPGPLGGMRSQPGYGQSPGPFSQSPRPQVGYSSSPRPAGYSQSPQRHQMGPNYNSPAHQQNPSLPFSQSPVPQNAHYSQSPPLRPHSQNHNYSQQSPVPGHPYSRSPVPQNNTPSYSQQSPMFAQSPANMQHPYSQSPVPQNQRYSQPSPASQNMAYACRSPGPMGHSYPSSPLPQGAPYPQLSPRNPSHPYSQSPIPQNSNIYAHPQIMSPAPQGQNYQQGSVHSRTHPYSPVAQQGPHSLPHHPGYGQSPIHQPQARQNPAYNQSPPQGQNMTMNAANNNNPTLSQQQQYHSDLSSEISAAISSPGPTSPGIGHIDFEPPIIDSQIQAQEADNSSSRSISQRTSPGGDQMNSNDMRQNSSSMVNETALNAMGDISHASSHDSNDIMDSCTNSMMQMSSNRQLGNQNRHSALNLIGPSSSSNTSSPIPSAMDASKPGIDMSQRNAQQVYGNSMYNQQPGSNEAQSPISNEQRLGFQVPTPSGSANSSYGTVTPVAADLSNVQRNSPRDVDNASVASVSSQHERLSGVGPGGYPLGGYAETGGSPRQGDSGSLLAHHAASMYHSNPFSRMGSTPPSQSPFSSQGGGAFRGLPLDHSSPQQGPVDYGSPVKPAPGTTKQQDVSSKSLSGLESLVDQIPSIADGGPPLSSEAPPHSGPAPVPTLENPYAAHAPLYNPYPYQPTPYAPPPVSNNGYSSALAAGSFVGYPGSPYGQLMRPTPGYLPEALSAYHPAHHSGYPGLSTQQYGPGGGYGPAAPTPNYSAYYNGYGPPSIPNAAANMPTYLSSHVLDHIHKNAAADASSVSFGGFC